jgi:predicted unusual protein kinase regulating ubiquinone biosynthesis (AarF/ABC1/UbiB family)
MRKNRITLIDLGSIATTDKTQLEKFRLLYKAMGEKDYRKVADMFLLLGPPLPNKDLSEVKEGVVRLYREFESLAKIKALPYHQKSLSRLLGDVSNVLSGHGVPAAWDLLRVTRASTTLDASLMFLVPSINYMKMAKQYVDDARERQQKKPTNPKAIRAQIANLVEQGGAVTKLAENAYFEGEYLRQRALSFEGYISKAAHVGAAVFHILSRAALVAALGLGVSYVHQRFDAFRAFRGMWAYTQLQRIPRLEGGVWLFWLFVAVYLVHELVLMKRVFKESEPSRTEGDGR